MAPRVVHTSCLCVVNGLALTPNLIFIRPTRRDDAGLLAHERTHCEQMRRDGTLRWWWRYLTAPQWRLRYEVEAYRVSLQHSPERLAAFAAGLAENYRLGISFDEAVALLLEP